MTGPARFAVPAKIDTGLLYDGEEGTQEASDDEEALKMSYASIMGRLKGGGDTAHVYHTKAFSLPLPAHHPLDVSDSILFVCVASVVFVCVASILSMCIASPLLVEHLPPDPISHVCSLTATSISRKHFTYRPVQIFKIMFRRFLFSRI